MKKHPSQSCDLELQRWGGVGIDPTRFVRCTGRFGGSVSLPQRASGFTQEWLTLEIVAEVGGRVFQPALG